VTPREIYEKSFDSLPGEMPDEGNQEQWARSIREVFDLADDCNDTESEDRIDAVCSAVDARLIGAGEYLHERSIRGVLLAEVYSAGWSAGAAAGRQEPKDRKNAGKDSLRARECLAFLLMHGLLTQEQKDAAEQKLNDKSDAAYELSAIRKLIQKDKST
jgi:hypothetical protein